VEKLTLSRHDDNDDGMGPTYDTITNLCQYILIN